ncbi:hypothetical protein LMG1873_04616 [Achromobacter piechaudii]|uniref:Uncharacterized protein n=2 Tax=Achromobacter piechaudii TaxID=72556 RepID=A0ABN7F4P2_9BURK|nr:hypothetical protein LMG1873_04616 [Achromobacter piechaudii]CAB3905037.1 hypothetical protein LMG2828_04703 [Achromobacter piechaudii]
MAYAPGDVPSGYDAMFLQRELIKIREAMDGQSQFLFLAAQKEPPAKPRDGMVVLALGAPTWDPGEGAGYYGYLGGVWTKL